MFEKSEIRCTTPRCVDDIAKYGERYHSVHTGFSNQPALYPGYVASCGRCGGHTDGVHWWHRCATCKADVEPGKLTGLFVPHNCHECHKKLLDSERASGNVCSLCRQPRSNCCC